MPVKYALNYLGFTVGTPRLPLTEPDEKVKALIQETLKCYKIDLPIANKPR
jgi:4-hydroxy-tetrahydrodipicolinate synthase